MERFYTGWGSLVCTVVVALELDNCSFGKLFSLTCTLPSGVIGVLDTKDEEQYINKPWQSSKERILFAQAPELRNKIGHHSMYVGHVV